MSKLFISDLHLQASNPQLVALSHQFLQEVAPQYDELFILGDFVEYWLGDDAYDGSLDLILNTLQSLSQSGTSVHLMYGNRDFLLGEAIADKFAINLIKEDHYLIEDGGQRILILHGDTLCTDDKAYQQLRLMLRNPAWQKDFLAKSLAERLAAAQQLREKSRQETQEKSAEIMDVNADTVRKTVEKFDADILIHGHTHRPAPHSLNYGDKTVQRVVLGDWHAENGSHIATLENGKVSLHPWTG